MRRSVFYRTDPAEGNAYLGDDRESDNWRLEGASFVWHYPGMPYAHVWLTSRTRRKSKSTRGELIRRPGANSRPGRIDAFFA